MEAVAVTAAPVTIGKGRTIAVTLRGQVVTRALKSDIQFFEDFSRSTSRYRYGYTILNGRKVNIAVAPMPLGEGFKCLECGCKARSGARRCAHCGSYDLDVA